MMWMIAFTALSAAEWPVVKTYEGDNLSMVKMPLGGIGTGTISLRGNGELVDWELRGQPAKGFTPSDKMSSAFLLRTEDADGRVTLRILNGPAAAYEYEGAEGAKAKNAGFPRFTKAKFSAAYPLAAIDFEDAAVPVTVRLEAMNPLVKGDADASGMPAALFRWRLKNRTDKPVKVSICGVLVAVAEGKVREIIGDEDYSGVRLASADIKATDDSQGEVILVAPKRSGEIASTIKISRTDWKVGVDQFVRNFERTGKAEDAIDTEFSKDFRNLAAMSVSTTLLKDSEGEVPFVIAWRFPHRRSWENKRGTPPGPFDAKREVGNYYAEKFASAFAAARKLFNDLAMLEAKTIEFVNEVLASKAPAVVKEAALFNVSTLRTETCFRTREGDFCGWEGCYDNCGSCYGNCTHVWGYEHALIDIWPELAKNMTELQFGPAMREDGMISFRLNLPIDRNKFGSAIREAAAADGQMQCVIKACENWQKTKDGEWIKKWYPRIRKAIEFCWLEGGWDGDKDGVMEGCQHNTMDVDYYGPNPQMEFLYLAALKAMAKMADYCDDSAFAAKCRELAAKGSAWTEKNLFNGKYYEHKVVPMTKEPLKGTFRVKLQNMADPDYQLATGCLVDQLVGDYASRQVGLGSVADEINAKTTLMTILERNRNDGVEKHFNPLRMFTMGNEKALLMAWYPPGSVPKKPFPYYGENMTGFEYVVAANLAQRGYYQKAEEVVKNIRDRYDGKKRNPFDEAECGHHYARALVAWTVMKAWEK